MVETAEEAVAVAPVEEVEAPEPVAGPVDLLPEAQPFLEEVTAPDATAVETAPAAEAV